MQYSSTVLRDNPAYPNKDGIQHQHSTVVLYMLKSWSSTVSIYRGVCVIACAALDMARSAREAAGAVQLLEQAMLLGITQGRSWTLYWHSICILRVISTCVSYCCVYVAL